MWKTEKKMRRLPRTERKKRRVLAHAVRQTLGRSAGAGAFHYFLGSSRSQRGGGRAGAEIDAQRPRKQQVNTRRRMQSPSFFKQRHTRRKPHRAARHASASPCAPVHGVRAARRRSPSLRGIFTTYSR